MNKRVTHGQVNFISGLPSGKAFPLNSVIFYDRILLKNKKLRAWLKNFPYSMSLSSGEKLKTLASLQVVLRRLARLRVPQTTELCFVAIGGGSVGDFVGFLASVYLRGRPLIHVPSTWLAAVDSAHGGKNGLNLDGEKNQLGTFYPAQKVYISAALLSTQPLSRLQEALGEVLKIGIVNDPKSFSYLEKNILRFSPNQLLKMLPELIRDKYRIVKADPYEMKGLRRVLNLGHTLGHVLESYYGRPHGICVNLGLLFSVRWSYNLKLTDEKNYIRISNLIEDILPQQNLAGDLAGIPQRQLREKLFKDKKRLTALEVDFIFIEKVGQVSRKKVTVDAILQEVQRQIRDY